MLSIYVDIRSPVSLDETRGRLQEGLEENAFLEGAVDGNRVVVRRHEVGNAGPTGGRGGPRFYGRLVSDEGPVRLRGRVAMSALWRVSSAALLAILLLSWFGILAGSVLSLLFIFVVDVVLPAIYFRSTQKEIAETLRLVVAGGDPGATAGGA